LLSSSNIAVASRQIRKAAAVLALHILVHRSSHYTEYVCHAWLEIQRSVDLEDVRFEGGHSVGTLEGVEVTSFIQATMADKALGTMIHGMLGLPFLSRYDVDLDRIRGEQHLKEAGAASADSEDKGRIGSMTFPGVTLPGDLIGIPVQIRSAAKQ